ncbi:MAG: sulfate adenylyltransferase [Thermoplasmata archaeon]
MLSAPHGGNLISIPELNPDEASMLDGGIRVRIHDDMRSTIRLISRGVYSPLKGFNNSVDLHSILKDQRLSNGTIWSMPILLPVSESIYSSLSEGDEALLSDSLGTVSTMLISDKFKIDLNDTCRLIFGTDDPQHPGVNRFLNNGNHFVGGDLNSVFEYILPFHERVMYPKETRKYFEQMGWKDVVAFQTRNIPHLGHEFMHLKALESHDGLFINPVIGRKKSGDFRDEAIIAAYDAMLKHHYPEGRVIMSPINYEMQYAGPRETLHHAIMRKNFGASSFIVGRDHAGVGNFYGPLDAQRNCDSFEDLGINILKFEEASYCRKCNKVSFISDCNHDQGDRLKFSGTEVRKMMLSGSAIENISVREEVLNSVRKINPMFQD